MLRWRCRSRICVWLEGEADGGAAAATRDDLEARADEIAGGLAMNPYYRCYEAADGFLALACLNLSQRGALLALFRLDDPTIDAPDLRPADPAVLAGKEQLTAAIEGAIAAAPVEELARAARSDRRSGRPRALAARRFMPTGRCVPTD